MLDNGKSLRSYIYITDVLKMLVNILFYGKRSYIILVAKSNFIKQLAEKISGILKVNFIHQIKVYLKI